MRPLLLAAALAFTANVDAQTIYPNLEAGTFAGPIVKIQNGNDKATYSGSYAAGVWLTSKLSNGFYAQAAYTYTDGMATREAGAVAEADTAALRMVEINATFLTGRPGFRFEPLIGFALYDFEDTYGFFTSGWRLAVSPRPSAQLKPWVGLDFKYYGLRPFIDDGLYVVTVTGSVTI